MAKSSKGRRAIWEEWRLTVLHKFSVASDIFLIKNDPMSLAKANLSPWGGKGVPAVWSFIHHTVFCSSQKLSLITLNVAGKICLKFTTRLIHRKDNFILKKSECSPVRFRICRPLDLTHQTTMELELFESWISSAKERVCRWWTFKWY